MEILEKLILVLSPTFGILGTFLIMNADSKKIKENPLVGITKVASYLDPKVNVSSAFSHERFIYSYNKKKKRYKYMGVFLLIVSFLLALYSILF